ncbi:MAG: penicillin-binding protein 1C [Myxococcota bacterium]
MRQIMPSALRERLRGAHHRSQQWSQNLRSRKDGWRQPLFALLLPGLLLLSFVLWPLPSELLARGDSFSLQLNDRQGLLLRELRSSEEGRSLPLPGDQIPPWVRAAFVAAEDQRFGHHPGVDPLAIGRAILQNLRAGRVVSGASTLPQQLARRLKPHDRGLAGKIYEAAWALRLSFHLSDEQLLLEYLNRVPLSASVVGVEAAAQTFFARSAAQLSLGQAALIAGMAASPARFDPYRRPEVAQARMGWVLSRMVEEGSITAEEAQLARETPLDLDRPERVFRAPHVTEWIVSSLKSWQLEDAVRLETTLDAGLQAELEGLIRAELSGLKDRQVSQAAVLVIDNHSGDVLAYLGSADFLDETHAGQNDGVRARRQPGSALKPFAYGMALAQGMTPATVLSDMETSLSTPGGAYAPRNYDRRVHGPVRLRAALANSYNIPAVKLAEKISPERLLSSLRLAGFESLDQTAEHYGVGLVLGNGDVTLWELTRAYRGLAMGGRLEPLRILRRAWDGAGRALSWAPELLPRTFMPEPAVALLTDILADEQARAPAFGLDNALRLPFPVAVKTGTSHAHVDNWTVGFTRERTVGVWVGNFDGTPMKDVSGITGAGPIFKRVMIRAMQGVRAEPLVQRTRFESLEICPLSGLRLTPACPSILHEVFLPGTAPEGFCRMHRWAAVHPRTGARVPCDTPGARRVRQFEPGSEYFAWARGEGRLSSSTLQDGEECQPVAAEPVRRPRILHPQDGDVFGLDPSLPAEAQAVPVFLEAPPNTGALELWRGAERFILEPPYRLSLPVQTGRQRLELHYPGKPEILQQLTLVVEGKPAPP